MVRFLCSLLTLLSAVSALATNGFNWSGATVYFVITDRFCNGDPSNDVNYGRITDYGSERLNAATFHGGDFKGMLSKAKEGYFTRLGVDVVWMTDVYEQIHGWMSGSGSVNDFPHYGYHGYYPLDYTQIDKNYGTVEEFRELIDTLHSQGIRVMLGANLNNPGYPTLLDAVQYGFADTGLTEKDAVIHRRDWSYDDFFAGCKNWNGWYDSGWIRLPDEGWDESDPLQATLYGLPDFKDESDSPVKIPSFLKSKWHGEAAANNKWVNPSAVGLRDDRDWSPMQYVIAWISSWVEEFGIDGFRCDIVENVHLNRWRELYDACNASLERWRNNHPEDPASQWDEKFYMTGDFEPSGIEYKPGYASAGFSSIVNCKFPKRGNLDAIVYTWQAYSDSIDMHSGWHPFSYLNNSYHREADSSNMLDCATTLMLSPGVAQVFYGDESGRGLSDARLNVDSNQAFRSDMNWHSTDSVILDHYRRLGTMRQEHPAISRGRQTTLDGLTCVRSLDGDMVVIRLCPEEGIGINVAGWFDEGEEVEELYSGSKGIVRGGEVSFPAYLNNVAVIARKS